MSTKSTVALYGKDWHLYEELADDFWHIWLEFPKEALEATDGSFALRIPIAAWRELRHGIGPYEKYLDMPKEELRQEAEAWVADRLLRYNQADERTKWTVGFGGAAVADINDPFETQVEDFISWHTPPEEYKPAVSQVADS